MAGYLITFEGIEGSGKTTQAEALGRYLRRRGHRVQVTREPGGTKVGEAIRKVLLTPDHRSMDPTVELLLYEAARAQHLREVIRPALKKGRVVLCDRFADATVAYQGGGRGLPASFVAKLNEAVCQRLKPDLTILLDCPVSVGLGRIQGRGRRRKSGPRRDRLEREDRPFHERVRQGYLEIARRESTRVHVVDATESEGLVHAAIARIVDERIR